MVADTLDFNDLGFPIGLAGRVRVNSGKVVAEAALRPEITAKVLADEFTEKSGMAVGSFTLATRVFAFDIRPSDEIIVQAAENGLPLVIRRDGEVIVNFDIGAALVFQFDDSKRPIYTYVPGFHIHMIPEVIRRPLSNLVASLRTSKCADVLGQYRRLPLTSFEFTLLLLNTILAPGCRNCSRPFQWPSGKEAVFVSLHDVDTKGFLQRRERDPLFRIEEKHQISSTWFIPTSILNAHEEDIDFLLESGNEVGWHGNRHDHRDHVKPYADRAVQALTESRIVESATFPIGMRLPKLLKSNYLYGLLERSCPSLCFDTSFLHGIAPYYLYLNGNQSTILEIPTTVPADIRLYNELHGLSRVRRVEAMLKAQIARTQKLIEVGALVCIVTHPEKTLSERPDFLDVYNQYLSYIRGCPNIWFTTAGELYKYWTQNSSRSPMRTQSRLKSNNIRRR